MSNLQSTVDELRVKLAEGALLIAQLTNALRVSNQTLELYGSLWLDAENDLKNTREILTKESLN